MEQMKQVTIGIDASRAVKKHLSGIEHYSRILIERLIFLKDKHRFQPILYTPRLTNFFKPLLSKAVVKKISPPRLWSQLGLAWETLRRPPSVLFIPAHTIPFLCRGKVVVTVHDLGFKHYPKLYPFWNRWYHNITTSFSVRRARRIITVSEFTKQDILRSYPNIKASKITVVRLACDRQRFHPFTSKDMTCFRDKWGPYILFLGRLEHKKNIEGIVRSYILLKETYHTRHKLVLAGQPKYGFEKVRALIESLPTEVKNDIITPGYIAGNNVPRLLREADLFLFPTFFEGFGLPILEAFASGVPVVTSNTTALPEVAGAAALLVNPKKPREIADACQKVINNDKFRKELIQKGAKRVSEFSWPKTAEETLKVLLEVADGR